MLSTSRPLDMAAIALAVALGALAILQWRAAESFGANAVSTTGEVVSLREAKRVLLDPEAEVFATVQFTTPGGDVVRAELSTSVQALGIEPRPTVGTVLPIAYDPTATPSVRYGTSTGAGGALVLALLAVGALFAPALLRQSSLRSAGGG